MNFLAHSHLSGDDNDIKIGNFIADSVKGNKYNDFREGIKNGILLHRRIDWFTDRHEIVKNSMNLIRPVYGRYSGIITDIYYDHFLAVKWNDYNDVSLSKYVSSLYSLLERNFFVLPARNKRILPFMVSQNWLKGYANFAELEKVFYGMDRRTGNISGMKNAVVQLKENYEELESHFMEFYPLLQNNTEKELDLILKENI